MSEFYHDPAGVSDDLFTMKQLANDYKNTLDSLTTLINQITASNDWIDLTVKTSYLQNLTDYMSLYQSLYYEMNSMVMKLEAKSGSLDALESRFS
mgnify:CR=1 FL=1